jgi:hypothetical protein
MEWEEGIRSEGEGAGIRRERHTSFRFPSNLAYSSRTSCSSGERDSADEC